MELTHLMTLECHINELSGKVLNPITAFPKTFFFFFLPCCSAPLAEVLLTSHKHLFRPLCALHCGATVSVNSALQHHLVCALTFRRLPNFGASLAGTYGAPLAAGKRPMSNMSDHKSGLQGLDLTTMALDFTGGG